jgi:hypothetical protein
VRDYAWMVAIALGVLLALAAAGFAVVLVGRALT